MAAPDEFEIQNGPTSSNYDNAHAHTRFGLGVKGGQANTGRKGRTCLARLNSQARTGSGKK